MFKIILDLCFYLSKNLNKFFRFIIKKNKKFIEILMVYRWLYMYIKILYLLYTHTLYYENNRILKKNVSFSSMEILTILNK